MLSEVGVRKRLSKWGPGVRQNDGNVPVKQWSTKFGLSPKSFSDSVGKMGLKKTSVGE